MARKASNSVNDQELTIDSVEEGFKLLDETTKKLSEEDISLEDSFKEFEKGMKILKLVNEKIDRVEKQVMMITDEGTDGFQ